MTTILPLNKKLSVLKTVSPNVVPPASSWDGGVLQIAPRSTGLVSTVRQRGVALAEQATLRGQASQNPSLVQDRKNSSWKQFLFGSLFGLTVVVGLVVAGPSDSDDLHQTTFTSKQATFNSAK